MTVLGKTKKGYTVVAIELGEQSPMMNHKGGEIAVDEQSKTMFTWAIYCAVYGVDSIMKACESYN